MPGRNLLKRGFYYNIIGSVLAGPGPEALKKKGFFTYKQSIRETRCLREKG
jgi:hypothetical protein